MPAHAHSDEQHSIAVVSNVEIQPSGTQFNSRDALTTFKSLFASSDPIFDDNEQVSHHIRQLALKGLRTSPIRSIIWRLFLGQFPSSSPVEWSKIASEHRAEYSSDIRNLVIDPTTGPGSENPLAAVASHAKPKQSPTTYYAEISDEKDDSNIWAQYFANNTLCDTIKLDLVRTHPDSDYFSHPHVQAQMLNILFVWCRKNPDYGYRQGMNELCSLILHVVASNVYSSSFAPPIPEIKLAAGASVEEVELESSLWSLLDPNYVEHDTYYIFSKIMLVMAQYFVATSSTIPIIPNQPVNVSESAVVQRCEYIFETVLPIYDPEIHQHLVEEEILPTLFLLRWVRLIFAREFHIEDTAILWDAVLSQADFGPNFEFINYICLSMILYVRPQLIESDNTFCLRRLMKFPPVEDITVFVDRALYYKNNPRNLTFDANSSLVIPTSMALSTTSNSTLNRHDYATSPSNNFKNNDLSSSTSNYSDISSSHTSPQASQSTKSGVHSYTGNIASSTLSLFGSFVTKVNEAINPSSPHNNSISSPVLVKSSNNMYSSRSETSTSTSHTSNSSLSTKQGNNSNNNNNNNPTFGTIPKKNLTLGEQSDAKLPDGPHSGSLTVNPLSARLVKANIPSRTYSSDEYLRVTQFSSALYAEVIRSTKSLDIVENEMESIISTSKPYIPRTQGGITAIAVVDESLESNEPHEELAVVPQEVTEENIETKHDEQLASLLETNDIVGMIKPDDTFDQLDDMFGFANSLDKKSIHQNTVIEKVTTSTLDDNTVSSKSKKVNSNIDDHCNNNDITEDDDLIVISSQKLRDLLKKISAINDTLRSFNPSSNSAVSPNSQIPMIHVPQQSPTKVDAGVLDPTEQELDNVEVEVPRLCSKEIQQTLSAHTIFLTEVDEEAELQRKKKLSNTYGRKQLEVDDAISYIDEDERIQVDLTAQAARKQKLAQREQSGVTTNTSSPSGKESIFSDETTNNNDEDESSNQSISTSANVNEGLNIDDLEVDAHDSIFNLTVKNMTTATKNKIQGKEREARKQTPISNASLFDSPEMNPKSPQSSLFDEQEDLNSMKISATATIKNINSTSKPKTSEKSKQAFKSLLDDQEDMTDLFGTRKKTKTTEKGIFDDF